MVVISSAPLPRAASPLTHARQLLVVKTAHWTSTTAELQRYLRHSSAADWQASGRTIKVSVGHHGLGWGIGRHPQIAGSAPRKQEGDGRAPAGMFAITELFGEAGPDSPFARRAKLPYHPTTPALKCVDDPHSRYYNQLVDLDSTPIGDWNSYEDMLRHDERYAIGAVIAHNSPDPVPGAGSCIFLHVWQSEGVPTAGCTAGALADITEICAWLDAAAAPLLIQLPAAEYAHFREAWALP